MTKNKEEKLQEIFELANDLDSLLTDRISDLSNVKGFQQSRHAYIYYRTFVWKIKDKLKKL